MTKELRNDEYGEFDCVSHCFTFDLRKIRIACRWLNINVGNIKARFKKAINLKQAIKIGYLVEEYELEKAFREKANDEKTVIESNKKEDWKLI